VSSGWDCISDFSFSFFTFSLNLSLPPLLLRNKGEDCLWSHTKTEFFYHPFEFKTKMCINYQTSEGCNNKIHFCSFAHGEPRVVAKIPLPSTVKSFSCSLSKKKTRKMPSEIFSQNEAPPEEKGTEKTAATDFDWKLYKTKKCPKILCKTAGCLDWHDERDRRRPSFEQYEPFLCPNAYTSFDDPLPPFTQGNNRCSRGDECTLSHNKIEELYHPDRFKLSFCRKRAQVLLSILLSAFLPVKI